MNHSSYLPARHRRLRAVQKFFIAAALLSCSQALRAQDGKAGITQATNLVTGYFDTGITLLYAIGAVVGLVGAVKVYNAWSHGDQQTNKLAASWFGACIFLVVVAAVLRSFFGVA